MLAELTNTGGWEWHAQGKHPAAADFITLGRQCPMSQGLAAWIARSFPRTGSGGAPAGGGRRWQFWIGGSSMHALACGYLAESADSLGRPYPLLLLGRGSLPGWRDCWSGLPTALSKSWAAMDKIVRAGSGSLGDLKQAVAAVPAPTVPRELDAVRACSTDSEWRFSEHQAPCGSAIRVEIAGCLPEDGANFSALWLARHAGRRAVPTAVFIGRCGESTALWLYARPLAPEDFLEMWSL
jgi:type VI secretion system protein VasJ